MAIPVYYSEEALALDALPVVKVRHYAPGGLPVYAYGRFYLLGEELAVALYCFERSPAPDSRVAAAFSATGGKRLLATLSPTGCRIKLETATASREYPAPTVVPLGGSDEQGWHWGGSFRIPASALQEVGLSTAAGATFGAAVFRLPREGGALGASHPIEGLSDPMEPTAYTRFRVARY